MQVLPSYVRLHDAGELAERIETERTIMRDCALCPRHCRVDRLAGEKGCCLVGSFPTASGCGHHFGEERPLVGQQESGNGGPRR